MKRFAVFTLVLFLLSPCAAFAEYKIGIVDLFRAFNESDTGKRAKTDLEALYKAKASAIEDKRKMIESRQADFEKQSSIMSAEAKRKNASEIQSLELEFQRMMQDSQVELKKKEAELNGDIMKELKELLNKIGQEGKYTLLFERMEGLVLFSDKTLDITDMVIEKYNAAKKK